MFVAREVVAALLLVLSLLPSLAAAPDSPGSFEEPLPASVNPGVVRDGAVAYDGLYSLRLSSESGTGMASYLARFPEAFTGTITVSGWVRAAGVTGAEDENHAVKLQFVSRTGAANSQLYLPLPVGDYDWQPWSYTVSLPPGDTYQVAVYPMFGAPHTGAVWHDAIRVTQGGS